MDKLTKDQKDEYAVSLAALALYDGEVGRAWHLAPSSFRVPFLIPVARFPSLPPPPPPRAPAGGHLVGPDHHPPRGHGEQGSRRLLPHHLRQLPDQGEDRADDRCAGERRRRRRRRRRWRRRGRRRRRRGREGGGRGGGGGPAGGGQCVELACRATR